MSLAKNSLHSVLAYVRTNERTEKHDGVNDAHHEYKTTNFVLISSQFMFSCRPEKEAKQKQQIPGKKIIKIGIIIMKLFILASALMLVLVFSSYVSADDPSDLDTAESQASFGYGYGTKVSNFMSSSKFML